MRRILLLTWVLCLAVSTALAQDVMTVAGGPETHKVVLDNDQVRVLDVRIQPGQKVAMHSHPANVVYYVSDAKVKGSIARSVGERGGGKSHCVEKSKGGTFPLRLEIPQERRDFHLFHRPGYDGATFPF